MTLPKIQEAQVHNRKVLLRVDIDVPLHNKDILDDSRLHASLETITYLQNQNATIILCGHLGRPDGQDDAYSLDPVAKWFAKKLGLQFTSTKQPIGQLSGWQLSNKLYLLENLRFDPGEHKNSPELVNKLANIADVYCNDAFAVSHRNNASITGVCKKLPHYAGIHLQKEVEELDLVFKKPKHPLVVIIGGAKLETKLPLVEKMHAIADYVLVGGKIAAETQVLEKVTKIDTGNVVLVADLIEQGTDITQNSIDNFLQVIKLANMIVWNGPMGLIRPTNDRKGMPETEHGTRVIADAVSRSSAHTILGGGDTTEFLQELHILDKFSFVSTGGGAMLLLLSGEKLPGLIALCEK